MTVNVVDIVIIIRVVVALELCFEIVKIRHGIVVSLLELVVVVRQQESSRIVAAAHRGILNIVRVDDEMLDKLFIVNESTEVERLLSAEGVTLGGLQQETTERLLDHLQCEAELDRLLGQLEYERLLEYFAGLDVRVQLRLQLLIFHLISLSLSLIRLIYAWI